MKKILIIEENLLIGEGIAESLQQMSGYSVTVSVTKNITLRQKSVDAMFISASQALKNLADMAKIKKCGKGQKIIIFSASDHYLEEAEKQDLGDLYLDVFFLAGEINSETKGKLLPLLV